MSSTKKTKKTAKTKKSGKPRGRNIRLSDGTLIKADDNSGTMLRKGLVGQHKIPKQKFSTETGKGYEDYEVTDDLDSHEYPPPSKNPEFRKFWVETIDSMINRDNFKPAHLRLLEVYCRLCVELRRLDDFVMANGHTYRVVTIAGELRRTYPEIHERHKVLSTIEKYARLLDLKPAKDKSKSTRVPKEDEEWS